MNKSAAVREVLAANPTVTFKDATVALATKGVTGVSSSLFYLTRSKLKAPTRQYAAEAIKKNARRKFTTPDNRTAQSVRVVGVITGVKALADEVGGMDSLKTLVEAMSD